MPTHIPEPGVYVTDSTSREVACPFTSDPMPADLPARHAVQPMFLPHRIRLVYTRDSIGEAAAWRRRIVVYGRNIRADGSLGTQNRTATFGDGMPLPPEGWPDNITAIVGKYHPDHFRYAP
jgi:hypothetical protein